MAFTVYLSIMYFFFKQKTAYDMRISDWSSDVCSSDLGLFSRRNDFDHIDLAAGLLDRFDRALRRAGDQEADLGGQIALGEQAHAVLAATGEGSGLQRRMVDGRVGVQLAGVDRLLHGAQVHDREILSEDIVEADRKSTRLKLQSLMRISYAVFCLK